MHSPRIAPGESPSAASVGPAWVKLKQMVATLAKTPGCRPGLFAEPPRGWQRLRSVSLLMGSPDRRPKFGTSHTARPAPRSGFAPWFRPRKKGTVVLGGQRRLSRPPHRLQLLDILFFPHQEAAQAGGAGPGSYPLPPALPPCSEPDPLPAAPRAPVLSSGQCAGHRACRNSECPGWDWKSCFHFHVPGGSEGWLQHRAGGGAGAGGSL